MTKAELIRNIKNMNVGDNAQIFVLVHSNKRYYDYFKVDGAYRPVGQNEIVIEATVENVPFVG
jgi:hypothetical protein